MFSGSDGYQTYLGPTVVSAEQVQNSRMYTVEFTTHMGEHTRCIGSIPKTARDHLELLFHTLTENNAVQ